MEQEHRETDLHRAFQVSVVLKALNGILEVGLGIILIFTGTVSTMIIFLTHHELIEDPQDIVANYLQHLLPFLGSHTQLFAAIYLLSHGVIKIFLVIGLLRNKLWAYPASIFFLILFIVYQLYRYSFTHSITLLLLTIFDVVVLGLVGHEYYHAKRGRLLGIQFDTFKQQ